MLLSKILKKSVSLAMNSAKCPSLKFFALKSDQKDSTHTDFTSRKSDIDSTGKQVNKVDSHLIEPNANNVSVATQKTPDTESTPQKLNQKQSSSVIEKESAGSSALKENDQKLKASDLENEEKKQDLRVTGFFKQTKLLLIKYYQNTGRSKQSKIFINLRRFWNFLAITSITACIGFIIQHKGKDYEKNSKIKQILKKYSVFKQKQPYIESPLYLQMKSCLQKQIFGQPIKLVAGCPGIGKTTATKKILQQMKQRGQEVFYFSFSMEGQENQQQESQLFKQFYKLMLAIKQKFHGDSKYKGKKVKIVLDDINKLEKERRFRSIMRYLYTNANIEEVDIICISNSSGFIERQVRSQDWRSYFQKDGKVIIIQDKNKSQEAKQFQKKVAYQYCDGKIKKVFQNGKEYDNPIIAAIVDLKVTTRMVVLLLRDLIEANIQEDEKKALEYIQRFRQQQVSNKQKLITNIFENISDRNAATNLIRKIIQTKEHLEINNCSKLKPGELGSSIAINSVLDTLQRQNLLIFCRPRTRLEREAFKIFSEKMKTQQPSK